MHFPALIKPTSTSQGHPKFNKDTLTTLQLVKTYNPSFVTTFIVSQSEAQYLTGEDLRRYENMITLKKKKEINAKYTGLLKSKVNTGISEIACKQKSVLKTENPKPPRLGSPRTESKRRAGSLKSQKESSYEKSDVKEIFKNNVYYGSTSSSVNDFLKCATDHLPSPKDIIEKTGRRIQTFWNIQKPMECENPLSQSCLHCVKNNNAENQDYVSNQKNDTELRTRLIRKQEEKNILQEIVQNVTTKACVVAQPEIIFKGKGLNITLKTKAKTDKTAARTTQTSAHRFSTGPPKRNCFSLYNICSTNSCRVLYKNCILCNRRNDYQTACNNKLGALVLCNKNVKPDQVDVKPDQVDVKPDEVVEKRSLLKKQSSIIGFVSFQFTYYKVENATMEHILEYRFTFDDGNNLSDVDLGKEEAIESNTASPIENFGITTSECGLSINIPFKILVTFGIILSLWGVYLYTENLLVLLQ